MISRGTIRIVTVFFLAVMMIAWGRGRAAAETGDRLKWSGIDIEDPKPESSLFTLSSGEDSQLDEDPRYERIETWVNVPDFGLQKKVSYVPKGNIKEAVPGERPGWQGLRENNPALYSFIRFFNPPFFLNIWALILTVIIAFGFFFVRGALSGISGFLVWCMWVYCWGRIISFLVVFFLIWNGTLPQEANKLCLGFCEFKTGKTLNKNNCLLKTEILQRLG